ncbi:glutathione synthase [Pseudonocardia abyssalis]|uniref:Glutathione synthetase n=1 Tax=Pseudonocardia abyssalis TaxID=2792008 RepID=A0ABS6URB7_9PSEU|nr:glutathione synthase [Pseudonocardia abyssalis]MBW0113727.1 glutathione synthase [Pseudonocardia abyssalis]MBW0134800.1 glutathione synthase [Pseudonocardia abyssalis]
MSTSHSSSRANPQLHLVFVIDEIDSLDAAHDTSVALMESAQARGHRILVTTMGALGVSHGRAVAVCTPVQVRPATLHGGRWRAEQNWYSAGAPERWVLDLVDAVFVRTDPPVDAAYLRGTYVLDLVDERRTIMINDPAGLRNANEKLFSLQFPELCPDTVVSSDIAEIVDVTGVWGAAVVKPTDGMAGRGIMLLRPDDPNLRSILEAATSRGRDHVVVQRFIPESVDGDRRVIVLDGAPIGVVRRVASGGEFRCNMAAGASVVADSVTPRDKEICTRIADRLAANGLIFVGIDVIGDYLTEINVTSPTGVREIDAFSGTRLSDDVVAWVETRHAALHG